METIEEIKSLVYKTSEVFPKVLERTEQVIQEHHLDQDHIDITDTPISPFLFKEDPIEVIFSEEVTEAYLEYLRKINDPVTAFEYSLLLFGHLRELDDQRFYVVEKLLDCSEKEKQNSRTTSYDVEKVQREIDRALEDKYTFISFCHTHPRIPESECTTTVASYLSTEERAHFGVRNPGLNLSLQDLIQYENLYRYSKGRAMLPFETVLMYNGDIAMFYRDDDGYHVCQNVFESKEFKNVSIIESQDQIKKK